MLPELFANKELKPKEKTETLAKWITDGTININDLIAYATHAKAPVLATCIESMEFVTQNNPEQITRAGVQFILTHLNDKAPRVKWECGKVTGNCIHLFPDLADQALNALLVNTTDEGTVVRWSAAFAIGKLYNMHLPINDALLPAIEATIEREEKNSIKKIYLAAIRPPKTRK
jgi:HEAT repeat protein